ncbi:MAG: phospholipid N-methyltransferase [Saprospiraceae bacterium]|nr:MAG: phospholipid N-methyltransferase [Saprospiraceae bacterium]
MKHIDFLREGLKNLKTVGTLTRSSKYLCKNMVKHVNFDDAELIVELGAGDGVITKYILEGMTGKTRLLTFEVNSRFCEELRDINDDRLVVAEDSAENLGKHLEQLGTNKVDYIISAIPFVALPKELGYTIIQECFNHLKKGGLFIQVHYSLLSKNVYENIFGNVDINFVPINVPPAFVLVSEKR